MKTPELFRVWRLRRSGPTAKDFARARAVSAALLSLICWAPPAHPGSPAECERVISPDFLAVKDELSTGALPAPDYRDRVLQCNAQRLGQLEHISSNWLDAERATYSAVLDKTSAQILVVPFQVQGYALDRIERALMSIDLGYELGTSSVVPDPTLVARALGEGSRRIDPDLFLALAQRLKARKVIVPFVGHDNNHAMTITIQVLDVDTGGAAPHVVRTTQRDWRGIQFTDEAPPFMTFHGMLPRVVADLALTAKRAPRPRTPEHSGARTFPSSPAEFVADGRTPASVALSVLGALESPTAELARERLFERALIASMRFDPGGGDTAFRQAYALMALSHRPAALAVVGNASTPNAVALRALLNGDLPGARAASAGVTDPLERLLLQIGIEDLRQEYGDPTPADGNAAVGFFGAQSGFWLALASNRFGDANPWVLDSSREIKVLLDSAFPVPELALQAVQAGAALPQSTPTASLDVVLDIASARHVRKVASQLGPTSCCDRGPPRAFGWDLMWLLEGRSDARLVRKVQMVSGRQGNTKRALSLLDDYEPFFSGHPALAAERGLAAYGLMLSEPDDLRASRAADIRHNGLLVAETASGETRVAFRGIGALGDVNQDAARLFWNVYAYDFPRRSFWPLLTVLKDGYSDQRTYDASARESLLYSTMDLDPIANVPQRTDEQKLALADALKGRFIGAAGRAGILALLRPSTAAPLDPIEELREEVKQEPNTWLNYYNLGLSIIRRDDDYSAAAKIFLSYPQFQMPDPPDRVALSHEAYDAGSLLYLHGHTELSEPLYKIAAGQHTGSEAELTSASRLLLLAGDFDGAMAETRERATRYPSAEAYCDYLSLLHATGHGKEAWQSFPQLALKFDIPPVWISALVGHRIEGRSEAYVREWLRRPEIRSVRLLDGRQFAPAFAIMWSATDRIPPPDLAAVVASVTDSPAPRESDLARFAAAYTAVRHEQWGEAAASFAMVKSYLSYTLPYRAMAAAKSGDRSDLENSLKYSNNAFDPLLAQAILAGAGHDSTAALDLLRKAFIARPNEDYRPIITGVVNSYFRPIATEYVYAEACEWLYTETHDQRFVARLLEWTESYQKAQPTQAWPYAMEYTYRPTGDQRMRALALTLYLDPRSPRIQQAPPAEVREARAWLRNNNPFLMHPPPSVVAAALSRLRPATR